LREKPWTRPVHRQLKDGKRERQKAIERGRVRGGRGWFISGSDWAAESSPEEPLRQRLDCTHARWSIETMRQHAEAQELQSHIARGEDRDVQRT
jgi:hypothetical protein